MAYGNGGPTYTAAFSGVSLGTTVPFDIIGILPSTVSRVCIHSFVIGNASTDVTEAQLLGVQMLRGSTASSTSAALTPRHVHGHTGVPTAGSSVTQPSSTPVSTASAVLIHADTWNVTERSWNYKPHRDDRPVLDLGQRLHFRVTAPTTPLSVSGALTFSEIGKVLV